MKVFTEEDLKKLLIEDINEIIRNHEYKTSRTMSLTELADLAKDTLYKIKGVIYFYNTLDIDG